MHGSAVGTATPKQPKSSGIQSFNKDALRFLLSYFHNDGYTQTCLLSSNCNTKQAKWHSTHWVRGLIGVGGGMGDGGQVTGLTVTLHLPSIYLSRVLMKTVAW